MIYSRQFIKMRLQIDDKAGPVSTTLHATFCVIIMRSTRLKVSHGWPGTENINSD